MDNDAQTHPTPETLTAFGLGTLEPTDAEHVSEHVAACDPCSETLAGLAGDTFIDLVRRSDDVELATDVRPAELSAHPRYRTLELLGRGGMGDVYKAEHLLMNREVALKLINRKLFAHPQVVDRFRREVQAAARLSHPNIVTAFDAEQVGDVHFLVMEYVDGTDLAEVVRERGPLPVNEACGFIQQVCRGLQHAHEQGMVHRDIKPHNLMVTSNGVAKILDFGLATLTTEEVYQNTNQNRPQTDVTHAASGDPLTTIGTMMGTPDFISPEQARGEQADARSDIYSLGCTLYYLLSGDTPFREGSAHERVQAHAAETPLALALAAESADLPAELTDVVQRMMAKDRAERFQSAAEVATAMEPFVSSQERTETRESRASSSQRGRFGRFVGALGAVVALVVAAVIFVRLGQTTLRVVIDDEDINVRFGARQITVFNDDEEIHIEPGEENMITVSRAGEEIDGRTFKLTQGQKVVLHVSVIAGDAVRFDADNADVRFSPFKPRIKQADPSNSVRPGDVAGKVQPAEVAAVEPDPPAAPPNPPAAPRNLPTTVPNRPAAPRNPPAARPSQPVARRYLVGEAGETKIKIDIDDRRVFAAFNDRLIGQRPAYKTLRPGIRQYLTTALMHDGRISFETRSFVLKEGQQVIMCLRYEGRSRIDIQTGERVRLPSGVKISTINSDETDLEFRDEYLPDHAVSDRNSHTENPVSLPRERPRVFAEAQHTPQRLFTINMHGILLRLDVNDRSVRTRAVRSMGPGFQAAEGLAISDVGVMFVATNGGSGARLWAYLLESGDHIDEHTEESAGVDGLTWHDGRLFAVTSPGGNVRDNPARKKGSLLHVELKPDFGRHKTIGVFEFDDFDSLVFDSNGRLIATDGNADAFIRLDPAGKVPPEELAKAPAFTLNRDIEGLTLGTDGFLYAVTNPFQKNSGVHDSHLLRVDPMTFTAEDLGNLGFGTFNLAADPNPGARASEDESDEFGAGADLRPPNEKTDSPETLRGGS